MAWLEALSAQDLDILIAGNHYAVVTTMDEEHRQNVTMSGAFGSAGPVSRSVRQADEATVSFSATLLRPGQDAGMADEEYMLNLHNFNIACRRSSNNWKQYKGCEWTSVRVSSSLDAVTMSADLSVPGWTTPA